MITAAQCRAARAWLNLTQAELGEMVGRGKASVRRFEDAGYGGSTMSLMMERYVAEAIQRALEERGMAFATIDGRRAIAGPEEDC